MNCENCGEELIKGDTDSRQEWFTEEYWCPKCEKDFVRRVEYQTQSELIASDTMEEIE
jgi:predicted RNA-binding Zn-ribbon protein involved in translation (DUF1610 family)